MLFLSFNLKHLHRVAVQFRARTRVSRPNDFIDVMVATELQQFVRAYEFVLMRLLLLLIILDILCLLGQVMFLGEELWKLFILKIS